VAGGGHNHAAAVQGFKHQPVGLLFGEAQAPVQEELAASRQVVGAVADFVNAQYAHDFSLVGPG